MLSFYLDNVSPDKTTNCEALLTKSNKYSILSMEILYPKTENVNVQMKLKPLWFGLFIILIET